MHHFILRLTVGAPNLNLEEHPPKMTLVRVAQRRNRITTHDLEKTIVSNSKKLKASRSAEKTMSLFLGL
ncbi:hypothetical protein EVAR_8532_1 [Eumeta japonica]|uniref:Uncharacterized protein n=1 Tax=Eumeta variegata TaxID=151549 RepID=A0A4C1TXH4_EUMVA|nr:hypothetical protein EVAR_8532_1 [Eumeta japonica]